MGVDLESTPGSRVGVMSVAEEGTNRRLATDRNENRRSGTRACVLPWFRMPANGGVDDGSNDRTTARAGRT